MRILNVRLGLATNSSSTHSIIFLPNGVKASEVETDQSGYGWSCFQLTRKESKLDYLAITLYQQLQYLMGDDIAEAVTRDWCGPFDKEGYVDHQSEITLPRNWDGKGINKAFFDDFKAFLMRDDIVIAGGNDNDDEEPAILGAGGVVAENPNNLPVECYGAPWVAKKDGDYWTLFNRDSGAKLRVTFQGDDFVSMPKRSQAPELVDVKITDFCPFDCSYCYMDSTKEGKHGDRWWLDSLCYALGEAQVFEVAIGGGEPTLHPRFPELLERFRSNGIVPNFTTKNLGWLNVKATRKEILRSVGAWAFSVETAADIAKLIGALKAKKIAINQWDRAVGDVYSTKVIVQHVVGVAEEEEFRKILEICAKHKLPITLLGFKEVGRGPTFGAKQSPKWLDILVEVTKKDHLRVAIDTALADRYWDDLIAAGVPEYLITRKEGQFSCYIDAVQQTINVSSYTQTPGANLPANRLDKDGLLATYANLPHS